MKSAPGIFSLPPVDFRPGICSICGRSGLIRYHDTSSGFQLGSCCVLALLKAERFLSTCLDLRHPTPEEGRSLPNH